ncbi:MAG: lipoyl synthase [Synergistaceae bacterium]|jgi:lipoic acid synthetase|nr:lipoyl synthase [Synergistaceae bacterium]
MERKPEWLRKKRVTDPNVETVEQLIKELGLNTVCREAMCPNYGECFSSRTATFMILGRNCTRNCRFCNVTSAEPSPADPEEPLNVARGAARLGLRYAVITSVTRDDLPDGGAAHFAGTIRAIRAESPGTAIEVLIPDFRGDYNALKTVADAAPDVISHNMETVASLYAEVRPEAEYDRSLELLARIKRLNGAIRSKSGIMLGLGETRGQVLELFGDLRKHGCELLTIGQYLAPSKLHHPVVEYVPPETFEEYGETAKGMGFSFVASAPFVRSSYRAGFGFAGG